MAIVFIDKDVAEYAVLGSELLEANEVHFLEKNVA